MLSNESESLDNESNMSCLLFLGNFLFLSLFFLIDLLVLLYFNRLYLFDNEYGNNGSGSGSSGTCTIPLGSQLFVPDVIESI